MSYVGCLTRSGGRAADARAACSLLTAGVPIEREISVLMVDSDPRVGRAVRPVVHVAGGLSADCEAGGAAAALAADGRRASDAILPVVSPTMAPEGIGLIILSLRVGRLRRVLS